MAQKNKKTKPEKWICLSGPECVLLRELPQGFCPHVKPHRRIPDPVSPCHDRTRFQFDWKVSRRAQAFCRKTKCVPVEHYPRLRRRVEEKRMEEARQLQVRTLLWLP